MLGLMIVVVAAVVQQQAVAQMEEPFDREIDAEFRAEMIDTVTSTLNEFYIFGDVAKDMERHVKGKLENGEYDNVTSLSEFTEILTRDLREICKDRHLGLRAFETELIERQLNDSVTDERVREMIEEYEYDNFAFEKLERLPGNIGYIKFNAFVSSRYGGETAVAAMKFLNHCDAIIFDLRDNGGGSPSMIHLISSYFFEEPQHLNSFYIRHEDRTDQFWTQSHVEGKKMPDIPLFVLTSSRTFSGAEEFAYNLKNMERATIIGETTGGGAHPVETHLFPNLNLGMRVPFGRAINPISGTNWEGTGVEPHIQVPRDEALEVAKLEALKAVRDRTEDEGRLWTLNWNIETMEALRNPYDLDESTMKKYAGQYGPRIVTFRDGKLIYQREDNPSHEMIPMNEDTFCFKDIDYFRLRVITDDSGNPTEVHGLYRQGHTDVSVRSD